MIRERESSTLRGEAGKLPIQLLFLRLLLWEAAQELEDLWARFGKIRVISARSHRSRQGTIGLWTRGDPRIDAAAVLYLL